MALTLLMGQFSAVISDLERDETSNKFLLPPMAINIPNWADKLLSISTWSSERQ